MADRIEDRPSLKDLDGVRVAVEDAGADGLLQAAPLLSRDILRGLVEAQLRAGGLKILGTGDFPTGDPHLRVTVSVADERSGLVACAVQVDFVQIVFLRRNPAVTFNRAQTWKADAQLVVAAAGQVGGVVRLELQQQVEQFIADYRAVNVEGGR